jgi:hypothetical protein
LAGLTAVAPRTAGTTRAASASASTGTAAAPGPAISRIVWAGCGGTVDREVVADGHAGADARRGDDR